MLTKPVTASRVTKISKLGPTHDSEFSNFIISQRNLPSKIHHRHGNRKMHPQINPDI